MESEVELLVDPFRDHCKWTGYPKQAKSSEQVSVMLWDSKIS
jgi:hypothetical protein